MFATLWLCAALASASVCGQAPSPGARPEPDADSTLVAYARAHPDSIRDSLRVQFIAAGADSQATQPLVAALRLASAYAIAWRDSFLLKRVELFTSWTPGQRRLKVTIDSLRRAGNDALSRSGLKAALTDWRASLQSATMLGDSAGVAAALGNIGAGLYTGGELDSSVVYLTRARDLAKRIGDNRTLGNAVGLLASLTAERGDLRRAAALYAEASAIRSRTGDAGGAAADQNNLGIIAEQIGDLDGARRAFEEALTANRRDGRDEPAAVNLVNLGNLASETGEPAVAEARYRAALGLYRTHGNRVDAALVLRLLGLLDLERGEYSRALSHFTTALAIYQETGPSAEVITLRRDIATVHAAMGNLQGALMQLGAAERLAGDRRTEPRMLADLALDRADLAVRFNAYDQADREYMRAAALYSQIGDTRGQAAAEEGRGVVLLARDDYARAQPMLEDALRTHEMSANPRSAALTRLLIGYSQLHRGDTAAARRTLTLARDTLRGVGDAVGEAVALGALGDLEARVGEPLAAESLYRRGLQRLRARPAPDAAWQLHAGLGQALRSQHEVAEATQEYVMAVAQLEQVSGALPLAERRAAYLSDKWDVYMQLAMAEQASGHTAAAFEASERMRAREMLDLLALGRVSSRGPSRPSDTLASREQDLRRRITRLTSELEGAPGSPQVLALRGPGSGPAAADAGREALARAQQDYANLLLELKEARSTYAPLVSGEVTPAAAVMRRLAPDEALVEYLVSDSTTVAFVVTSDTVVMIDLHVGRRALVSLVDFARGTLVRPTAGPDRGVWQVPLRRLNQYLIAPLETAGLLNGKRRLLLSPHAELHYLPFAALLRPGAADQYLIARYSLTYIPSASVWLRLVDRGTTANDRVLALAPRADVLPGSRAEVGAIGRIYGDHAQVLVGTAASERALREAAPSPGIIHLATYGVLNKDNPLFSFVEMTPEGADDGRLEVHEVFGLRLQARLVVLSACQTGLGAGALADVPAGDDWVGLVQAFLFAGASHVMATLWPVEDRATARFMEQFYGELQRGRSEADALADAQRQTLRKAETAHPFYWAGFTMSGGR